MFSNRCLAEIAIALCALGVANTLSAEDVSAETMQQILARLTALEQQNQALLAEVKALREEVQARSPQETAQQTPGQPTLEERVNVAEQRIKEQAQSKVGASERFPISITGMLLFDAFNVTGTNSPIFLQNYGDYTLGGAGGDATLSQSIIGFDFTGPHIWGDGQVHGSLSLDFYGANEYDADLRIRRGFISFDWKNRSIIVGQDKSIIAPLQPTSFARVSIPPLSGAGNLWLWRPQLTYEERVPFSSATLLRLQGSVFETDESYSAPSLPSTAYVSPARPAAQARVAMEHTWADNSKWAIGVSAHASTSHIEGRSIPSRVISADFLYRPRSWLAASGTLLHGENFANLGGVQPGVTVSNSSIIPIRGNAGWAQLAFPVTNRLTFDAYAGSQLNTARDLSPFEVSRSFTFAGNVLYRVGPNVVLGFEGAHDRIQYLDRLLFPADRYDATVAYLF